MDVSVHNVSSSAGLFLSKMQPLPGFRDFLPADCAARNYIFWHWRDVARRYGFAEWDGPMLELTDLYERKSGAEIANQLFAFKDKSKREVALRPELTPTLARVVAAHERKFKKPLKWFSIGQFFRYEKQQRGRLREFCQFNADIIGEQISPSGGEGELIAFAIDLLRSLGFVETDFAVRLGSRDIWVQDFLSNLQVPPIIPFHSKWTEFFQVLDKFGREPEDLIRQRLAELNISLDDVIIFMSTVRHKVLSGSDQHSPALRRLHDVYCDLRARGLERFIEIDLTIVRGLAYYNGTVFEMFSREKKERAIAGGGRYDNLLPNLFNVNLTALGFAMGDVVLTNFINDTPHTKARLDSWLSSQRKLGIYVIISNEERRNEALKRIQSLRDRGYRVDYPLAPAKTSKQFQTAEDFGATIAIVFGDALNLVKVKNFATRQETLVVNQNLTPHVDSLFGTYRLPDSGLWSE